MARTCYLLILMICVAGGTSVATCQERISTAPVVQNLPGKNNAEAKAARPRITEQQKIAIGELISIVKDSITDLSDSAAEKLYGLSDLASRSALLIWKYVPESGTESFKNITGTLLLLYEKGRREKLDRERINYARRALKHSISLWSSRDARSAIAVLQQLHALESELEPQADQRLKATEQFELAQDLLESDPAQSARLTERVVEKYVPDKLPEYLYKLKQIDVAGAARVLNKSLATLSSGQVYSFKHDLILQAYVLREQMVVYPVSGPVDFPGFEALAFPVGGVLSIDYAIDSSKRFERNEIARYTNASISALKLRLMGSKDVSPLDAAMAYFLIQKLTAYFEFSHAEPPSDLQTLQRVGGTIALSKGVSVQNQTHLVAVAREVASHNFLQLLTNNMSSAAEKSNDPTMKVRLRENEILVDIHELNFDAAGEKIFKLADADSREALTDNLNVARIAASAKRRDWSTVDESLEKIKNWNVRAYAFLESARMALRLDPLRTNQYLNAAQRVIEEKLEVKERPQMMAGLLEIYAESNVSGLETILLTTARAINKPFTDDDSPQDPRVEKGIVVSRYLGNDIWIYCKGMIGDSIRYQLKSSNLEMAFASAGKRDWLAAYSAAREIQERPLRGKAILGLCSAIL